MVYLVNISDLFAYVGEGLRKYVEGENVANANHVMYVGITADEPEEVKLLCLCLKSSDLFGLPHELNVSIVPKNDEVTKRISMCQCSCPAGLKGDCKHCVAVLIHLARNAKESIEVATCTDTKQAWGKLKHNVKKMYELVPARKMCHLQPKNSKYNIPEVPEPLLDDIFSKLVADQPNSLLSKLIKGYGTASKVHEMPMTDDGNGGVSFISPVDCKSLLGTSIYSPLVDDTALYCSATDGKNETITFNKLSLELKNFYLHSIKVDVDSAVNLCMKTKHQTGNLWLLERKKRITGSTAYQWITPLQNKQRKNKAIDWDSKVLRHLHSNFRGNANTAYGLRNEPKARECYERKTNYNVVQLGSLVHPDVPWLLISLDGLVIGKHTIEIKCPVEGKDHSLSETLSKWSCLYWDNDAEPSMYDAAPPNDDAKKGEYRLRKRNKYFCQVQLGMFVANVKFCDFIIYASSDDTCKVLRIPYEPQLVESYLSILKCVYFHSILRHVAQFVLEKAADNDKNSTDKSSRQALGDIGNK